MFEKLAEMGDDVRPLAMGGLTMVALQTADLTGAQAIVESLKAEYLKPGVKASIEV